MKPKSGNWYQYCSGKALHYFVHDGGVYLVALCNPDKIYDNGTGSNLSHHVNLSHCKTCFKVLEQRAK